MSDTDDPCNSNAKTRRKLQRSPIKATCGNDSFSLEDDDIPETVSSWKLDHLERLGIFYSPCSSTLDSIIEKCGDNLPELPPEFHIIEEFHKQFLNFDVRHYKDHKRLDFFEKDMVDIHSCLDQLRNLSFTDLIAGKNENCSQMQKEAERILTHAYVAAVEFLNMMITFMNEEKKRKVECCYEKMYTSLFLRFFPVCGITADSGECVKKRLEIFYGKESILSEPDIRCTYTRRCSTQTDSTTDPSVLMVGEVKRRNAEKIDAENFNILRDLETYDILGQHGGELLVELQDSCFSEDGTLYVLGAMCVDTQIVFTALEMSETHYLHILRSEKEQLKKTINDVGKSFISYTRPYNILKAADRQVMVKHLLRLACLQKNVSVTQQN